MKNDVYQPHKSSLGNIDANIMALLAYLVATVIGWIPGVSYVAWLAPLVLFFLEKESRFIKFHAMQAFLLQAAGAVLGFIVSIILGGILRAMVTDFYAALGVISIIGVIAMIVSIIVSILAILAMVGAYQYKEKHIPLIGGLAEKLVDKVKI